MFAHHVALLAIPWLTCVWSLRTIEVDEQSGLIVFNPAHSWGLVNSTLSAGGTHRTTEDPLATATFTFTGTGIGFKSPLWPYAVTTALSLDSQPPFLIDLIDRSRPFSGGGPGTVPSSVLWAVNKLANTEHTLVISVGAGQRFAVVDALIYAEVEPGEDPGPASPETIIPSVTIPSTSATASGTTTSTSDASTALSDTSSVTSSTSITTSSPVPSASTSSNPDGGSSTPVLAIALGTGLGAAGLLIVAIGLFFCLRRRKRPASQDWTATDHPRSDTPPVAETSVLSSSNRGFIHPAQNFPTILTWNSPQSGSSSLPHIPRAMTPASSMRVANPDANDANNEADVMHWQEGGQQYILLPNPHRPGTPTSMSGSSTPVFNGGEMSLSYSPFSRQTELGYSDPSDGGSDGTPSVPSDSSRAGLIAKLAGKQDYLLNPEDSATPASPGIPPPAYTLQ